MTLTLKKENNIKEKCRCRDHNSFSSIICENPGDYYVLDRRYDLYTIICEKHAKERGMNVGSNIVQITEEDFLVASIINS